MKKKLPALKQLFSLTAVVLFMQGTGFLLYGEDASSKIPSGSSVNNTAAVRSLEKAIAYNAEAKWDMALFETSLGASFDPLLADFPYVEALALAGQEAPPADVLERAEQALAVGLHWHTYTSDDGRILCARLYADTCRYTDALSLLTSFKDGASADAEYIRIRSLYGLGRVENARKAITAAMDHWPFDSRFPKLFLSREAENTTSETGLNIAGEILARLYLWEDEDRELLLLAVPFEPDPDIRLRGIQIYRNMGKTDSLTGLSDTAESVVTRNPLATVYALEYGIIDEETAFNELFPSQQPEIALPVLTRMCRFIGSDTVRKKLKERLASFDGIITDDTNHDGIVDTRIQYRLGRPIQAVFDPDQDGYPDYTVSCDMGSPATVTCRKGNPVVVYDIYPHVHSVRDEDREYTVRPTELLWTPVEWHSEDLGLGITDFFIIRRTGTEPVLTERLLINNALYYREPDSQIPGGIRRVMLDSGAPVSAETLINGNLCSKTTYSHGFPLQTITDRNDDGYFETTMRYAENGRLSSIEIDRNANRLIEYRELYRADGSVSYQWDSDENGVYEINSTIMSDGSEITEWLHPLTGLPVIITTGKGSPRSVTYQNKIRQIIKDPTGNIWWIDQVPLNSRDIVKLINASFNQDVDTVVLNKTISGGKRICAIRTGGLVFAELIDE